MKKMSVVDIDEETFEDFLNKKYTYKLVTDITASSGHGRVGKVVVTRRTMKNGDLMNPEFEKTIFVDTDNVGEFSAVRILKYKDMENMFDISKEFNGYMANALNKDDVSNENKAQKEDDDLQM